MTIRPIKQTSISQPTLEGAGVKLNRVFGFGDTSLSDPFLLLDDFRNNKKEDYINGFPWHPHRGIETITYILKGNVEHGDSLGNVGTLKTRRCSMDDCWLRYSSSRNDQKETKKVEMHGFQLWANLPSSLKMTSPNYQDIPSNEIKEIRDDDGSIIRIIIGNYRGYSGPVKGISSDPIYLDIFIPANKIKNIPIEVNKNVLAYIFEGSANFGNSSAPFGVNIEKEFNGQEMKIRDQSGNRTLVVFGDGDEIEVTAGEHGVRFLLVSGAPLREPVAWHGPIVMNTRAELQKAFQELNSGEFVKTGAQWKFGS